ncbi:hypothetical protein ACLKA6_008800 [Drosophila palustris]
MLKKSHKHKKRPEEVVELYKNNTFVSDSLSATCVSSVKFTADGQMSTKTIGKVGDRHLKAILKLPDLEERCAIPSNKNLYRLSIQLADNDSETHAADESSKDYYKTARTNQPQIRCKKRKEKQQVIQLANNLAKLQPQEKREQNILSEFEQSNSINSLLASNLNKSKELTRVFKATMRTIDDWYKFTFLLFLGTAAFLIYILCYDISIYLNEERRYLAKMRKAGIVLKCFFYVMHLLKVPIF